MNIFTNSMLKCKLRYLRFYSEKIRVLKTNTCSLSSNNNLLLFLYLTQSSNSSYIINRLLSFLLFFIFRIWLRINQVKSSPFLDHFLLQLLILYRCNFSEMISVVQGHHLHISLTLLDSDAYMSHKYNVHIVAWISLLKNCGSLWSHNVFWLLDDDFSDFFLKPFKEL